MKKKKEQLIQEIAELRNRCATLEITARECLRLEAEIQDARKYAENIDEFAVLLPGTDKNVAEEAVKRIMSCPEIVNGMVSIAFGVASAENKDQLAEAIKLSDERMYRDKSGQKES